MRDARWRKLWRDLGADRARALIMILGVAAGVFGVGTVLGARAILTREIHRNYMATRPPTAVFEVGDVAPGLVEELRHRPGVDGATARATVHARIESKPIAGAPPADAAMARMHAQLDADRQWRPLVLFVVPGERLPEVGTFTPLGAGATWPPPVGTMLVERAAAELLGAHPGDAMRVRLPGGVPRLVRVGGLVHDPALAPASMERSGWAYATPETLAALDPAARLDELWVSFAPLPADQRDADARARELGAWLRSRGADVHEVRVPPPGRHPHEGQMRAILLMMLIFSGLALTLAGVLAATLIAALLARQVREIGVMKAIGARTGQIAAIYLVLLVGLGLVAIAVSVPLSVLAARAFATTIGAVLNLELTTLAIPGAVLAIQIASGLLVPLAIAAVPVLRAARTTVRGALDQYGAAPVGAPGRLGGALARLPVGGRITRMAVRNAFRRRARLVLTLVMLATGGALFLAALDLATAWTRNTDEVVSTRHYAVELRLDRAAAIADVEALLRRVPGVGAIEAWGTTPAAIAHAGELDVIRTYPDGGHGSLRVLGAPIDSAMVSFPLLAGRWLAPGDTDAVVVNHLMAAQLPALRVGATLDLSLDGRPSHWRVVGVVRDVGSPATVYATDTALAQALGTPGQARLFRVQTTRADPAAQRATVAAIERALAAADLGVDLTMPLGELRTAIGDHMQVLITALLAMAALMGLVGVLGLASAMSTSVLERIRELGVMRALGATPWTLARLVAGEAVFIGVLSWAAAVAISAPLSAIIGRVVGALAFRTPLPLVLRADAMAAWLGVVIVVSVAAAVLPARRAARRSIRVALAEP